MFNPRVQIGDVKPLRPIVPQRSIDRVKNKDNDLKREEEKQRRRLRENDNEEDGNSIDEYA